MGLRTTGQVTVEVDRAVAFDLIGDPLRLAQCIPGCSDLCEVSSNLYSAVLTNEVAFIKFSFKVKVEIVKNEPPQAIEAKITGDAVGLAGRVVANAWLQLVEAGPGATDIKYGANIGLSGKLGGLGEPVFRAKSAQVAKEFAANLKAAIETAPTRTRT